MEKSRFTENYRNVPTERSLADISQLHKFDFESFACQRLLYNGECAVLDVGCGNSTFLVELASKVGGISILGTDIYQASERLPWPDARIGYQPEIKCSGNSMPEITSSSQDLVVSTWSVASHGISNSIVDAPSTYITEIGRVLRPGGVASIMPEVLALERYVFDDEYYTKVSRIRAATRTSAVTRRLADDYRQLRECGFIIEFGATDRIVRIRRPD